MIFLLLATFKVPNKYDIFLIKLSQLSQLLSANDEVPVEECKVDLRNEYKITRNVKTAKKYPSLDPALNSVGIRIFNFYRLIVKIKHVSYVNYNNHKD
jgi:hypothetical protein